MENEHGSSSLPSSQGVMNRQGLPMLQLAACHLDQFSRNFHKGESSSSSSAPGEVRDYLLGTSASICLHCQSASSSSASYEINENTFKNMSYEHISDPRLHGTEPIPNIVLNCEKCGKDIEAVAKVISMQYNHGPLANPTEQKMTKNDDLTPSCRLPYSTAGVIKGISEKEFRLAIWKPHPPEHCYSCGNGIDGVNVCNVDSSGFICLQCSTSETGARERTISQRFQWEVYGCAHLHASFVVPAVLILAIPCTPCIAKEVAGVCLLCTGFETIWYLCTQILTEDIESD